jgi:formimidoylglutamate deiminase
MATYFADHALLADGVRDGVRITVADGVIARVEESVAAPGDVQLHGLVLPGMANVHSHAFQRAMAGLAEWDAGGSDNFWSWREAMYRFAERLSPETQLAVARFLYIEMLKAGYTSVGEFHYLHNQPGGAAYAPAAAMAEAIATAAGESGMALTMMPTLYVTGGTDGRSLSARQKRFGKTVDELLALRQSLRGKAGVTQLGLALHSLRAVPPALMKGGDCRRRCRLTDPYPCGRTAGRDRGIDRCVRQTPGGVPARQLRHRPALVLRACDPHE